MDEEEFKERNQKVWKTWTGGLISSCFGLASVWYGFNSDTTFFGRTILILFGIFLQIPLGYYKIYKLIMGEE